MAAMNPDRYFAILVAGLWGAFLFQHSYCARGEGDRPSQERYPSDSFAEIRFIDAGTGRGIPLVELETVNGLKFVTDNAGRIAFLEPGLMDRELYFNASSHGYVIPKDGFGYAGFRITSHAGKTTLIKLERRNIAERICRLTGEGLYRDSVLLGHKTPLTDPLNPGGIGGQDSVQAAVYGGRVYWFWGDTQRMNYPLGMFRMAGATTSLASTSSPTRIDGIAYEYFVDETGFARAMMPLPERPEGVIWVGAVFVVPNEEGNEKLVGHYSRRKGLEGEYEQGIAVFNDDRQIFESVRQLPLTETWRHPSGHPIPYEESGKQWILFGSPNPNVRVPAKLSDVLDPTKYEAFTCVKENSDRKSSEPQVGSDGLAEWRWQRDLPPTDSKTEHQWIADGKIEPQHARFCPADPMTPSERIILHSGSVRWNAFRNKWVLVAGQIFGKPSFLGEVWYAEADEPTGPFEKAVRVVSHNKQTFYNVCHHDFLDREKGRIIQFEGTYTNTFSGNLQKTPRYDYNQVLYRLDLDNAALFPAQAN